MSSTNWESAQKEFLELLLDADSDQGVAFSKAQLDAGASPSDIFEFCISPALKEIGRQFETLEIYLPEMVEAAEIVNRVNDEAIVPVIEASASGVAEGAAVKKGKVVMATIQGDLHDIGKNMVSLILQVNGFEVIDMGINVPPSDIVDRAELEGADIIGMSSLLTTCLPYMKDLVGFLEAKGVRDQYAVIIGGAAPTPEFSRSIGVDGHGHTAAEAVTICTDIMAGKG